MQAEKMDRCSHSHTRSRARFVRYHLHHSLLLTKQVCNRKSRRVIDLRVASVRVVCG